MGIRILSTNYSGYSTDITFSAATGGTQVITGATIPYDFVTDYPYGDYSIYIPSFNNTCTLNVPVPIYEANISPSGATQYENVILSASTDLTNPTFVWTLSNFYDTSDTPVSSYTGQTLTEGYFTSTGSSNVTLVVTGDEGSATGTTFTVSAFSPDSITGLIYWIDPSNTSSVSTRTSGSDVFLESIDNLASTPYTGQSNTTAIEQPYYGASTGMTNGLNTMISKGYRNSYQQNLQDLSYAITGDTLTMLRVGYHTIPTGYYVYSKLGATDTPGGQYRFEFTEGYSSGYDDMRIRWRNGAPAANNNRLKYNWWDWSYPNSGLTYGMTWSATTQDALVVKSYFNGVEAPTSWDNQNSLIPAGFPGSSTLPMYYTDHMMYTLGGQNYDGYEEMGEWVVYDSVLPQSDITTINRYLKNKWGA